MSSIMDKSKLPTKMFLRSNSFQKLCSLAHPMRLRGFKSNREALKSVFESLIVTTRGVIQSVTYRILCFLFLTPFTKLLLLSRPLQGLVDAVAAAATSTSSTKDGQDDGGDGASTSNRLNTVRLILKLTLSMIVSTDKQNPQPEDVRFDNELRLSEDDSSTSTTTATTLKSPECPHRTEPSVAEMAVQTDEPDLEPEPEFFDCKEPPAARACQFLESSLHLLPRRPPRPRSGQRLAAVATVYGCVLCCAVQLSALVYLLSGDAVRFPPGLIFLILALAYIGFIMTRIFTSSNTDTDIRPKLAAKKGSDEDIQGGTSKALVVATVPEGAIRKRDHHPKGGLHPVLAAVSKRILATLLQFQQPHEKTSSPTPRQSRSATRTRMLLCADDKTISKVKIL